MSQTQNKIETKTQEIDVKETVSDNYIRESKIMLLASILYKKINNISDISGLFEADDELSDLYKFLCDKISQNKDYNVSTLFDNFEITNNSLIDKVINYVFPTDEIFNTYLTDTIKRVKVYELEKQRDEYKRKMIESSTDEEKYKYLNKMQEITKIIAKEKK